MSNRVVTPKCLILWRGRDSTKLPYEENATIGFISIKAFCDGNGTHGDYAEPETLTVLCFLLFWSLNGDQMLPRGIRITGKVHAK
jgi:hypothetical protein